jgi:hypothetical protein
MQAVPNRSGQTIIAIWTIDVSWLSTSRTSTAQAGPITQPPGNCRPHVDVPSVNRSGRVLRAYRSSCASRTSTAKVPITRHTPVRPATTSQTFNRSGRSYHEVLEMLQRDQGQRVPSVNRSGRPYHRGPALGRQVGFQLVPSVNQLAAGNHRPERQPLGQALSHRDAGVDHYLDGGVPNVNHSSRSCPIASRLR